MRRVALLLAVVSAAALTLVTSGPSAITLAPETVGRSDRGGPVRPNLVVVMADDMRADDLRFMPQVRRLIAARGLVFRNAFSPYPLCCPARASFLTGQYPHNHGVLHNEPPWGFAAFDDRLTLATSLQRAGYRTAFVGKYLNGYGAQRSLVTGRPSWDYVPAGWTDWYATVELPDHSPYENAGTYHYFRTLFNVNGTTDDSRLGEYQTHVVGDFARTLVRDYASAEQPFFLYLSALAPHTGFPREPDDVGPVRYRDGRTVPLATPARPRWVRGRFDAALTRSPGMPVHGGQSEGHVGDKPRLARRGTWGRALRNAVVELTRQRAESLYVLDREISRLVATLEETGALANTVLALTSDNGYFLGEHRRPFAKTIPYEPALRVPLLISGPGVPVGERFDPATTADLAATVLDLADAAPPHPADGTSLLSSIRHGDRGWTRPLVLEAVLPHAVTGSARAPGFTDARTVIGIRTARYKLLRWRTGEVELYDLRVDPNELSNLAEDLRYQAVRRRLERVWSWAADCRGTGCVRALPPSLQVGPARLATLTEAQADGVRARFGIAW